jgi:hypothetical protein
MFADNRISQAGGGQGQNRSRHTGNLHPNPQRLDVLSEKGLKTLGDEQDAARIWSRHYPEFKYLETAKDKPAVIDAFLVKGTICGAVETKCRYDMNLEDFWGPREGKWLITHEKLESARLISSQLCVPLYGFLYIVKDRKLLVKKIADETGSYLADIWISQTQTQKTINGGTISRVNAFIDMAGAKILE